METRFWDRRWVEAMQITLNLAVAMAAVTIAVLAKTDAVADWWVGVAVGCCLIVALINHAAHGPDDELPDY